MAGRKRSRTNSRVARLGPVGPASAPDGPPTGHSEARPPPGDRSGSRARRVVRLGVSLEPDLLDALDRWVHHRNSASRSEAIRFLIRKELTEDELGDPNADAVGAVMVLYRHTAPMVLRRLTAAQHRWGVHLQASTHFHLEGDACLEIMVLKGRRAEVESAAEDLRGVKGIIEGDYLVGTPTIAGGRSGHHHPHRPERTGAVRSLHRTHGAGARSEGPA